MLKKLLSFFSNTEPTNTRTTQGQPIINNDMSSNINQNNSSDIDLDFEIPAALEHPPGIMAFKYFESAIFNNNHLFELYQQTSEKTRNISLYFFSLSSDTPRRDFSLDRADKLEKALELLPVFVQCQMWEFGDIPPRIVCRDELLDLYKRLGKWQDAKRVIEFCAEAGAYPNGSEQELADLALYSKSADIAVDYIKNNPGTLQKDLYKFLANTEADQEMLKRFTRTSLQIRKVPTDKTNQLFINEQPY